MQTMTQPGHALHALAARPPGHIRCVAGPSRRNNICACCNSPVEVMTDQHSRPVSLGPCSCFVSENPVRHDLRCMQLSELPPICTKGHTNLQGRGRNSFPLHPWQLDALIQHLHHHKPKHHKQPCSSIGYCSNAPQSSPPPQPSPGGVM